MSDDLIDVTFELVGPCHISVVTRSESGIHRRSVLPGSFVDGVWIDTDLSDENAALVEFAQAAWTPEAVDAFVNANRPAPPALPGPHKIYQQTIWSRTTGAEAVTLKAALDQAEVKFQMLFNSSDFFVSDHPMFALLHWTIAVALAIEGEPNVARADDLLGPPTVQEAAALTQETA